MCLLILLLFSSIWMMHALLISLMQGLMQLMRALIQILRDLYSIDVQINFVEILRALIDMKIFLIIFTMLMCRELTCPLNQLRKLAPGFFRTTAQDAIIHYLLIPILLNSMQWKKCACSNFERVLYWQYVILLTESFFFLFENVCQTWFEKSHILGVNLCSRVGRQIK
jgi:hypothetical protein